MQSAASDLESQLDKIFHPDKFDVSQLNPVPVGDVDEGAKYYAQQRAGEDGAPTVSAAASAVGSHDPGGATTDEDEGPTFRRISSTNEAVTDAGMRRNLTGVASSHILRESGGN